MLGGRTIVDATGFRNPLDGTPQRYEVALKTGFEYRCVIRTLSGEFESTRIANLFELVASLIDKELNQGGETDIRAGMIR